jgi:hypothetical protein
MRREFLRTSPGAGLGLLDEQMADLAAYWSSVR